MDAEFGETQGGLLSGRETRWSMSSQRLEEIVAELMRPIRDIRRSFDTDLSALLEEYLTEAGLHALAVAEGAHEPGPTPNYVEVALLIQHLANVYGLKVDFLYQHVLAVSESLHKHDHDESELSRSGEGSSGEGERRRTKKSTGTTGGEFEFIELEKTTNALRSPDRLRPPPTLPRHHLELEPRQLTDRDTPLTDCAGERVGLLADFYVTWRLQDGFLVDELDETSAGATTIGHLRRISFSELQATVQAAASPALFGPIASSMSPVPPSPAPMSPPVVPPCASPQLVNVPTLPMEACQRKRKLRGECLAHDIIDFTLSKRVRRRLLQWVEFSVPSEWRDKVVKERSRLVLDLRRDLRLATAAARNLVAFDSIHSDDTGGFRGWSDADVTLAMTTNTDIALVVPEGPRVESDDDGFYSLGGQSPDCTPNDTSGESWAREVAARAAAEAASGGVDVREAGARVLAELQPGTSAPFPAVLRAAATVSTDVSRLFLATLFLVNEGKVRVVQGAPLTLGDFTLELPSSAPAIKPPA